MPAPKDQTGPTTMVDVSLIEADGYQRKFDDPNSYKVIESIANNWDWDAYDPVKLFHNTTKGTYEVMDGQGRSAAAVLAGLPYLPAKVLTDPKYAKRENRAALFLTSNRGRRILAKFDDFRAALVKGEPWAIELDAIITGHGLMLGKREGSKTMAAGEAMFVQRRKGGPALDEALRVIVTAWPTPTDDRTHGSHVKGLVHFIEDAKDAGAWDETTATLRLARTTPDRIHAKARMYAASMGTGEKSSMAWACAIRDLSSMKGAVKVIREKF